MDLRERLQLALDRHYTLERELGGGGMSRVFLATEAALGRRVVVKVLPPDAAAQVSTERFQREISLAAQLQQPHIVPVLTAGEADGLPYYTMPFVDGESLRARLSREGALPFADTLSILKEVARALAYAHQRGIVHRDIKPDNVLLSGGSAMVTDFGVAKALTASTFADSSSLTSLGVALGTPAYMSPEQASADPMIDHRADIYAFGALAYELLSGQPPFAGRPPQAMLAAHVSETPEAIERRRIGTPPVLAHLVMRCLAKRPADRPQNATEIAQVLDTVGTPGTGMLPTAMPVDTSRRLQWRRAGLLAATVFLLGAGAVSAWRWRATSAADDTPKSIAVLPLTSVGGASEDEPLRDGVTGEITNALGNIPGLNVKAASLVKAAWKPDVDVQHLGQTLGVSSLLQGTMQPNGKRIRITIQLVNAATGFTQWSGKFDFDFKDVFAIQDSIARAVVNELRVRLAGGGQQQLVRAATTNTEAHTLYLQGIYLWNKRTHQNIVQAIALFERARQLDPKYAQAAAGVAMAYAVLHNYADIDNTASFTKAVAAAHEALNLDPSSVEAHAALGFAHMGLYQNAEAERDYRHAIAIDSSFATAHQWLALVLARMGRFDEAVSEAVRAHVLDPQSRVIQTSRASVLYQARRSVEAEQVSREVIAFDPTFANGHRNMALGAIQAGQTKEAIGEAIQYMEQTGERVSWPVAVLGVAYARDGQTAKARAILAELLDRARRGPIAAAGVSLIYEALGDREHALEWLERGVKNHEAFHNWSRGPIFDGLRSDPRGAALLAQVEAP